MEKLSINIGSEKSCFFVNISIFLINQLKKHPFLYYAVEEALECAKNGYYATGIITFAQLLNLMKKKTPDSRHLIAHGILKVRPTKKTFEEVKEEFKKAASEYSEKEILNYQENSNYQDLVLQRWYELKQSLINNSTGL